MPRIKGWKRTGKYIWRPTNKDVDWRLGVSVKKTTVREPPFFSYGREVYQSTIARRGNEFNGVSVDIKTHDTLSDALKYVKNWMRKHPRG